MMNEYFVIGLSIIIIYFLIAFVKKKYLRKYRGKNIISHISGFILLFTLFAYQNSEIRYSSFRILLIVLTLIYFPYQVYQDFKELKHK